MDETSTSRDLYESAQRPRQHCPATANTAARSFLTRPKGPQKNKSMEFAPNCALDLARAIERNRRCSPSYIEAFAIEAESKIRAGGMRKRGVILSRTLRYGTPQWTGSFFSTRILSNSNHSADSTSTNRAPNPSTFSRSASVVRVTSAIPLRQRSVPGTSN